MLAGDPTASFIYFDKAEGCPAACQFGGMLPGDIDGFTTFTAWLPDDSLSVTVLTVSEDIQGAEKVVPFFEQRKLSPLPAGRGKGTRSGRSPAR